MSTKNLIGFTVERNATYLGCNVVVVGPVLDNKQSPYQVNQRIPSGNTLEVRVRASNGAVLVVHRRIGTPRRHVVPSAFLNSAKC